MIFISPPTPPHPRRRETGKEFPSPEIGGGVRGESFFMVLKKCLTIVHPIGDDMNFQD
jgi:hypothetical protein